MNEIKLVILDRDGVINFDSENYIRSEQEWLAIPNSPQAIAALTAAGYKVAVASNQSGLARGYFDEQTLQRIHHKMKSTIEQAGGVIDYIVYCPHGPDDNCNCRKPNAGLLQQIGEYFSVELNNVPVIGDSLRDIQAAQKVGALGILVRTGNGRYTEQHEALPPNTPVYDDLHQAVMALLQAGGAS